MRVGICLSHAPPGEESPEAGHALRDTAERGSPAVKLQPDVLEKMILATFAIRELVEGDIVWLSRFEEFWDQTTQLRRSDLLEGLAHVCSKGWIYLDEDGGRTSLTLTSTGAELASAIVSSGLTDVRHYAREQVLAAMRFHDTSPDSRGLGRRWHEAPEGAHL